MWTILSFKIEVENWGDLSQAGCYRATWNFLSRRLQHINNARAKKTKTDCLDTSDTHGYVWD